MSIDFQAKQTELFKELGVFFAFSDEQFAKEKKANVEYCSVLGGGDCVPVENAKEFRRRLSAIHHEQKEHKIATMGIDKIIESELVNHEAYYTGEIDETVEALGFYNVTYEQVKKVYLDTIDKHDNW